jgi:hypothetical protein
MEKLQAGSDGGLCDILHEKLLQTEKRPNTTAWRYSKTSRDQRMTQHRLSDNKRSIQK